MTYAVVSQRRTVEELSYLVDETISCSFVCAGVAEIGVLAALTEIQVNLVSPASPWITAKQVNDKFAPST